MTDHINYTDHISHDYINGPITHLGHMSEARDSTKQKRIMGVRIMSYQVDVVERKGHGGYSCPADGPGTYYAFDTQTTRDGKDNQAQHHGGFFKSEAERDAAVKKYLDAQIKKFAKLAAQQKGQ